MDSNRRSFLRKSASGITTAGAIGIIGNVQADHSWETNPNIDPQKIELYENQHMLTSKTGHDSRNNDSIITGTSYASGFPHDNRLGVGVEAFALGGGNAWAEVWKEVEIEGSDEEALADIWIAGTYQVQVSNLGGTGYSLNLETFIREASDVTNGTSDLETSTILTGTVENGTHRNNYYEGMKETLEAGKHYEIGIRGGIQMGNASNWSRMAVDMWPRDSDEDWFEFDYISIYWD